MGYEVGYEARQLTDGVELAGYGTGYRAVREGGAAGWFEPEWPAQSGIVDPDAGHGIVALIRFRIASPWTATPPRRQ